MARGGVRGVAVTAGARSAQSGSEEQLPASSSARCRMRSKRGVSPRLTMPPNVPSASCTAVKIRKPAIGPSPSREAYTRSDKLAEE
jgi:hypothetical protein